MNAETKKKSILLIDDEEDYLAITAELIKSLGYNVVCAHTLPLSLIKINNQEFNVILLDLCLKRVSGLRVIDQIRRNHLSMNHNTPIILLSGQIDPHIMKNYKHEIDDAVVKPATIDLLRTKLNSWEEKKHSALPIKNTYVQEYVQKRIQSKKGLTPD